MIKFLSGNLLESNACALVNTVNTVGVMGKGIGLQFKNEFSHNYVIYRKACLSHQPKTGQLLAVEDRSLLLGERLIINFPTKTHWRLSAEYSYIEQGLKALVKLIDEREIISIALPPLGCGNGGLDWAIVKKMICSYLEPLKLTIEVYAPAT
ncbi:MAG: macro domain-containing protein [Bacteroidota bacterium]